MDTPHIPPNSASVEDLTERELEVLRLKAQNCSNREIADELVLAVSTVKWYVRQVYGKLGIENRRQAVARAHALGLIEGSPTPGIRPCHNLPAQTTPFIGREQELTDLATLLVDPEVRLLTLVGPGGIGKTRLALEAAQQHLPNFADGVFYVSLAPLTSPESITPAVAEAIEFSFFPGGDSRRQLFHHLHTREMLLVLDNVEHLRSDTSLVSQLLQAAPRLRILTTSRERLNLLEETVFFVEGMAYPELDTVSNAAEYGAIQLFLDRASHLQMDLAAANDTLFYAARICRQVQGMPLAIVLAASWVHSLSLQEIVQEIARSFDFLQTDIRNVPERHRHIRAVFDPSWAMLSEVERAVLMRLSVFRGSFTRDAAQAVTGASLHDLSALVDQSMIRHTLAGRYDMHELLRQYAAEKLAASPRESQTTYERHSAYYASFMETEARRFETREQGTALEAIDREITNVTTAWHYMVQQAQEDDIRKVDRALWTYLDLRYRFQEAIDLSGTAVSTLRCLPQSRRRDALLGCMMARYAWFLNAIGEPERGKMVVEEALELLRPLNCPEELMIVLNSLSIITAFLNQTEERQRVGEEGLRIAREQDKPGWVRCFLYWLGCAAVQKGDYEEARRLGETALAIAEAAGDSGSIAAICSNVLSRSALALGNYAEAQQLAERAEILYEEAGYFWGTATNYGQFGHIAAARREFSDAQRYYQRQLDMFARAGGATPQTLETLLYFGRLYVAQGQPERAAELATFFLAHPVGWELNRDDARLLLDQLQRDLSADVFAEACQRGEALDFDSILADLLDCEAEPPAHQVATLPLSKREIEVLRLMAEGLSNAEIAQRLVISVGTVKIHTNHIFGKLGVRNRTEAAAHAHKLSLL